jgi:hypothetical protein
MAKIYRTLQGRTIDIDKLRQKNELMPAVGNMRVNARGDELGPGGKIIRTREQIMAEYYESNPNATPDPDAKNNVATKSATETQTYVPPTQTLKVEDTPVSDVVKDVEVEVKKDVEETVPVEQAEAKVVEKATEAVQKARSRRRGLSDATGE